jgi:(1->4)-alpha-D-glucan 1-alpha-D-glucosylmutase
VSVPRTPTSTYRLQITPGFDLHDAAAQLPYLHALGVDWVYLSPLLTAEHDSQHGYDVISHETVDPSRGGPEGLATLSAEARRLGLGVVVDIVPNHVGVATPRQNPWWWDVLAHGQESHYASYFDIDWAAGGGRLRIPVLADDADLERDLAVENDELVYFDHRLPIAPGTGDGSPAQVHDRQHYELVGWRLADTGLNYRRFFAINTLAALRVEDREVFDATHAEIGRWFTEGLVDGLRVDHPDGLRDPGGYLQDLARLTGGAYVLVEKILEPGESLPGSWATAGTTGYDALAWIDRVLTDPAGEQPLSELAARLGAPASWTDLIHDTKRAVADGILGSEIRRIARETGSQDPGVVDAIAELAACFPVYRSYLPDGREHLQEAFAAARTRRPGLASTFDELDRILGDPEHPAALRFQQTSGMVMAKGVEDCAFYRYPRLTSLNEVGGDPSVFSVPLRGFHEAMETRQAEWPHAMTALTTHDTKRSEDTRARITVLAEIPGEWEAALGRLLELAPLPDPAFGSLLWQAVLGAWPATPDSDLRERLHAYAEKAMREAGDHTTWTDPDEGYEAAVHAAVDAAFDDEEVGAVLAGLCERIDGPACSNALAAKLVALTMPGVPDVYQGTELWDQSLVDPDNRRPVDFAHRAAVLDGLDDPAWLKAAVVVSALSLRRDRPELFTTYAPVTARGSAAEHVLAFDRGGVVAVVTRLPVGLAAEGWGDTELGLPPGGWTDVLAGRAASPLLGELLDTYPVALLVRDS